MWSHQSHPSAGVTMCLGVEKIKHFLGLWNNSPRTTGQALNIRGSDIGSCELMRTYPAFCLIYRTLACDPSSTNMAF
jgi:hypothetical protein